MSRKTRAQKIHTSQRKSKAPALDVPTTITPAPTTSSVVKPQTPASNPQPLASNAQFPSHAYVGHDLKHIAWTALACLILLAIATLFLSDLAWFQTARQALHLPTLSL